MENNHERWSKDFASTPRPSGSRRRGPAMKPLLTIEEAAALLGIKTQTLYLWVSQRRVPCRKIGRLVRFTETDLEEFIEKQKQHPVGSENGALSTRW
jgi:excisionase family DNA binding protein